MDPLRIARSQYARYPSVHIVKIDAGSLCGIAPERLTQPRDVRIIPADLCKRCAAVAGVRPS